MRRFTTKATILAVLWHGWFCAAPPVQAATATMTTSAAGSMDDVAGTVRRLAERAREMRPQIDRSQFELDSLLEDLDYDPERIARFVSDEIALEVYPGVLRGAHGTLLSRAGNSLDQALLLATLLEDAGEEAVIRRATLEAGEAESLVHQMARPRASAPSGWDGPGSSGATAQTTVGAPGSASNPLQAARERSDSLILALQRDGTTLGSGQSLAPLVEQARDYYWVDTRGTPQESWRSLHPATSTAPDLQAVDTFDGEIPRELVQHLKIELLADRRLGGRIEESALMRPIERTSASLVGTPITLTLLPDQFARAEGSPDPEELLERTNFILPFVDGHLAPGARALSVSGQIVDPDALAMGAGGVFDVVSEKLTGAAQSIAGLGSRERDQQPIVAIEAIRLRVTTTAPGVEARTTERDLFHSVRDLSPEASQGPPGADLVRALARSHTLVSAVGSYSPTYLLDSLLEEVTALETLVSEVLALDSAECSGLECLSGLRWQPPAPRTSMAILYNVFDSTFPTESVLAYRPTPSLFVFGSPLVPSSGTYEAQVDIVTNERRTLAVGDGTVAPAPAESVLAGVWETQVEVAMSQASGAAGVGAATSTNSWQLYDRAAVEPQAKSSPVARAMLRDLDEGYVVLGPPSLDFTDRAANPRWWRVNPDSGQALGMTRYGGQALVTALALLSGAVFLALGAVLGVCVKAHGGNACTICVIAFPVILLVALGSTLGSGSMDMPGYFSLELERLLKSCSSW